MLPVGSIRRLSPPTQPTKSVYPLPVFSTSSVLTRSTTRADTVHSDNASDSGHTVKSIRADRAERNAKHVDEAHGIKYATQRSVRWTSFLHLSLQSAGDSRGCRDEGGRVLCLPASDTPVRPAFLRSHWVVLA